MTSPQANNEHIATNLTKYLLSDMRDRLANWGAWWRKENVYELRLLTGITSQSSIYRLMRSRGTKAGYRNSNLATDAGDAQVLHERLKAVLDEKQYQAIFSYYVHGYAAHGTDSKTRAKAINKLLEA